MLSKERMQYTVYVLRIIATVSSRLINALKKDENRLTLAVDLLLGVSASNILSPPESIP